MGPVLEKHPSTKLQARSGLRIFRGARGLVGTSVVALFGACSSTSSLPPRGQLVLAVGTDMAIPKDINQLQIVVRSRDKEVHNGVYPLDGNDVRFPATLGIVGSDKDPTPPVSIRVLGLKDSEPKVLREVSTTIPKDRIATLQVTLQWICLDSVKKQGNDTVTTCPNQETCIEGTCASPNLDSSTLPNYDPAAIYGGGSPDGGGQCFDVVSCFQTATEVKPTLKDNLCTFTLSGSDRRDNLNVALRPSGPYSGQGICRTGSTTDCFIPLDGDEKGAWLSSQSNTSPGTFSLPLGICAAQAKFGYRVVVSRLCQAKTKQVQPCGAWSTASKPIGPTTDASSRSRVPNAGQISSHPTGVFAEPQKVVCGPSLICDLGKGDVCCWSPSTDPYIPPTAACVPASQCGSTSQPNRCDGDEDCLNGQRCCQNLRTGASCKAGSCDELTERKRCSLSNSDATMAACSQSETCAACATSIPNLLVPVCIRESGGCPPI